MVSKPFLNDIDEIAYSMKYYRNQKNQNLILKIQLELNVT